MPYLRTIWHFMPQNRLHQKMVNTTIANFFAIVLQYNSNFKIVLQQYSKKYKYILFQNVTVGIRSLVEKKWGLERNNKERLKNNILIKK